MYWHYRLGSLSSGVSNLSLVESPLQPLRPIALPSSLKKGPRDHTEPIEVKRDTAGNVISDSFDAAKRIRELDAQIQKLTNVYHQEHQQAYQLQQWLLQPLPYEVQLQYQQRLAELVTKNQLYLQTIEMKTRQIEDLKPLAAEKAREKEQAKAVNDAELKRLYQEWTNTDVEGVKVNAGKSMADYKSFLKQARESAKRQKKEEEEAKVAVKEAEKIAKQSQMKLNEAAEALEREKWNAANTNGTEKDYIAHKKRETAQTNRLQRFEEDYLVWSTAHQNQDRNMYKQYLEDLKKVAAQASKDEAKAVKRSTELKELNAKLTQRGIEPVQEHKYDEFTKRWKIWKQKNPGSSNEQYIDYYTRYTKERSAWLKEHEGGDYEAYLKDLEVKQKQKEKWEANPKNNGKLYEEYLQQESSKKSKEENDWRSKFKEGMADEASFNTWKLEQLDWKKKADEANQSGGDSILTHGLGDWLLFEAYNSVLVEFAKSGNNFNNWVHFRTNNRTWRTRVLEKQIELLNKIIANDLLPLSKHPDRVQNRVRELQVELFKSKFPNSSNDDYNRYVEWMNSIEEDLKSKTKQVVDQGINDQQTPKQFYHMVTLYYDKLFDFVKSNIEQSFNDWLTSGFENYKLSNSWWKGAYKGLSGIVKRGDFANRDAAEQEDYLKALEFLKQLKKENDARAKEVDAKESKVKNDAVEARKAEKSLEKQKALAKKQEAVEEKEAAKQAVKESARQEKFAKGEAKREAMAARKAREAELLKAKKAIRDAKREENKKKKLDELKEEISGKPLEIASQLLVLDEERKRLQQLFDEMTVTDDHPILALAKDPKQPTEQRKTGRLSSMRGMEVEGEMELVPPTWPIAQMKLTNEQHNHLFFTEVDVWPDREEADNDDTSSMTSTDPPTPMPPTVRDEVVAPPPIGVNASSASGSTTSTVKPIKVSSVAILDSATVFAADPLLFNRAYAKRLLTAHIESLKEMHKRSMHFNPKVKYSNVAEAINTDTNTTVDDLMPFFEHMLRYRNTMLTAKKFLIKQEIQLVVAGSGSFTALSASLEAIENMNVKPQWAVDALRMLESDNGRLPGQLYQRQPYFLPLRVFAPPRVGKSATALLAASLAKRLGMVTLYSVSPNKNTPIAEMSKKLARLGWGDPAASKETDRLRANELKDEIANVQTERRCLQMQYNYFSIEDVPGGAATPGLSGRSKCTPNYDKIDMVMYSSDIADDAMRVGAMLSDFKLKPVVTFHIRDEAQSLAKELKNEVMTCHKVDVPPPVLLQYLRAYYSNVYSLNCNVTATHFPTLLESDLFGYMGSIEQNIRAGLPMTATSDKISTYLGSNFLPRLVPALQPLRPNGYIGVEHFVTWKNKDGIETTLQVGANHSGLDESGVLRGDTAPASSSSSGSVKTVVSDEQIEKLAALKAEKLELESKKGKNKKDRTSIRNKLAKIKEDIAELEARDGKLDALSVLASNTQSGSKYDPDPSYSSGYDSEDEEDAKEQKEALRLKRKNETSAQRAKREEEERLNKQRAAEDAESVKAHFIDFLDAKPKEVTKKDGVSTFKMIPSYIGALNAQISDRGMSSILRMLGKEAHKRAQTKNLGVEDGGVAFLLYTSTVNNRKDVTKDKIKIVGDKEFTKYNSMDEKEAEEAKEEEAKEEEELNSLMITELKDRLRVKGVEFRSKMKRDELLQLLREAIEYELDLSTKTLKELGNICREAGLPIKGSKALLTERIEEYRARGTVTPGEAEEDEDDEDEELPELDKLTGSGSGSSYLPCDGTSNQASNKMAALVAVYDPDVNRLVGVDQEPFYHCFFTNNSDTAISAVYFGKEGERPRGITKFSILGYGMLQAGLTVQSVLDTGVDGMYNFCPKYVALATPENAPLDGQLQIAGRAFVELKESEAPEDWKLNLLGVQGMVGRLNNYSNMEETLANIKELRMYEALKDSFNADFVTENSVGTLGVVGTRRSDFGSILGLTPELAKKKAEKAAKLRETFKTKREARKAGKQQASKEREEEREHRAQKTESEVENF